ncbi:3-deoxy-D-manno-octulosonate 8-phosphate phosphatase [Apibacter muscae]|uniref:3-deoxy-D-manno-octulosonate 8-phosphate phosphatase n=1 Tax=Apibacter muscae TaxID=2509004 RepID=A0A563DGZ7_9FLAO|nr:HAD hydrolase family protein [Apibacter muscae]TWP29104.1 3-deoxy-D-manno-octulosonate 8-phosphate phosphatase [Apibacter muscae]TWP30315.1 3-deoxy-D-manno-octulosonate 8-phosphate phosphatase [Apibacter muscae]
MKNYKEKLNSITSFVFDVDGVMTDGSIILMNKEMIRSTNTKDGFALQFALKKGYKIGIITGGRDASVVSRLNYLGITDIYLNSTYKWADLEDFIYKYNLKSDQVLYMGDDLPDYEVMSRVGVGAAPKDACSEILTVADYISPLEGGKGCVRDVIEQVLRVRGDWDYLETQNDIASI